MASITFGYSVNGLVFAAKAADQTGAKFREDGDTITIYSKNGEELVIPRYCFTDAWPNLEEDESEQAWRSLLQNKSGKLLYWHESEFALKD